MDLTDTSGMATLGTSGDDVLTWDASDLFVNGGDGLDILLGDESMPEDILSSDSAPYVYGVEAALYGDGEVPNTNIADYGVGLDGSTITLYADKWDYNSESHTATYKVDADNNGDADLTLQIDASVNVTLQSPEPGVDELVFILKSTGA